MSLHMTIQPLLKKVLLTHTLYTQNSVELQRQILTVFKTSQMCLSITFDLTSELHAHFFVYGGQDLNNYHCLCKSLQNNAVYTSVIHNSHAVSFKTHELSWALSLTYFSSYPPYL